MFQLPYADGFIGFWDSSISIQHPLADFEIVPWDSSLVLAISRKDDIINNFIKYFSHAEDLASYNRQFK